MAKGGRVSNASRSGRASKASSSRPVPAQNAESEGAGRRPVPQSLQQKCLNIFRDALKPSEEDSEVLQQVKGHLYNRAFSTAFGKQEYLRVYASRWSPSRALAYLQILRDVQHLVLADDAVRQADDGGMRKLVSLGGGAGAELVAIAGWLSTIREADDNHRIEAHFLDVAAWDMTVQELRRRAVIPPEISRYASAAAKEANRALLSDESFAVQYSQQDLLHWDEHSQRATLANAKLVTLMFTLNELYSTSMQKTQNFLKQLTWVMSPGEFLLVVDSPGSYSTVSINGAEKKYPMQWLLDFTLLEAPQIDMHGQGGPAKWQKVMSDESRWFRLLEGLQYPIELENMRYQIHLYRKLGDGEAVV